MVHFLLLFSLLSPFVVFAKADHISIFANPDSAFLHETKDDAWGGDDEFSAYNVRSSLKNFDRQKISEWKSYEQVLAAFIAIRDTRLFLDPEKKNFLRRLTWLYAKDGCYARAGLGAQYLDTLGFPDVSQVYIFGSLYLKKKDLKWIYHVAPMVRVQNEVYVLDPAIEPKFPLRLKDWLAEFLIEDEPYWFSTCSEAAWSPDQNCGNKNFNTTSGGYMNLSLWNEMYWMPAERKFLREDADRLLGDYPPWSEVLLPFVR